jgi:ubiquinone/menaquinone biosynthesis C-methylase UbiE
MNDDVRAFYNDDAQLYDYRWRSPGGIRNALIQGKIVEELISSWSEEMILEAGSGTGRFSTQLIECANFFFAADISRKMLHRTRERISQQQYTNFGLVETSIISLPFSESSFDAIFTVNVLNHVSDIDVALSELSRVLKIGGRFIISFANASSYYLPAAYIINRQGKALRKDVYSEWRAFSSFYRKLQMSGLEIDEIRGNVHIPKWLDFPVARRLIAGLDLISRKGFLTKYAPTVFVSGTKIAA